MRPQGGETEAFHRVGYTQRGKREGAGTGAGATAGTAGAGDGGPGGRRDERPAAPAAGGVGRGRHPGDFHRA
ncbi:protein of unknown function [Candidatus Hydrogenisulfobacillus filiaventi]|uniref:Uncharacterized protein n=1 Tax=Candidatus Hydrogenisulfobacillus filiaventi TaxID=2707344 RepID=A0A6F8ZDQ1_9FIRM|nr:protein of unknown function [Candidatus Hydrogenisulfobacillus filiaventi]